MKTGSLIFVILIAITAGCGRRPSFDLAASHVGGSTVFEFSGSRINGILDLSVWQVSDRKFLWDMNLNYFVGGRLAYGEIPKGFSTFNGGTNDAVQRFPFSGTPPIPLPADTDLRIQVTVQYDTLTTASATSFFYDARTDENGRVISLAPTQNLGSLQIPERPKTNTN
jgi:hypothetical protein